MVINSYKKMIVSKKTDGKCSMCGSTDNISCECFIPEWTRIIKDDYDNLIPLCDECRLSRGYNFIEIGSLKYLPELCIEQLLRYYRHISMYLYKYVRLYGKFRTNGKLDIDRSILIMESYDHLIKSKDIDWESIK